MNFNYRKWPDNYGADYTHLDIPAIYAMGKGRVPSSADKEEFDSNSRVLSSLFSSGRVVIKSVNDIKTMEQTSHDIDNTRKELAKASDSSRREELHLKLSSLNVKNHYNNITTFPELENFQRIQKRQSNILGFKSYTDLALFASSSGSCCNALDSISTIIDRHIPLAREELAEISNLHESLKFNNIKKSDMVFLMNAIGNKEDDMMAAASMNNTMASGFDVDAGCKLIKFSFGLEEFRVEHQPGASFVKVTNKGRRGIVLVTRMPSGSPGASRCSDAVTTYNPNEILNVPVGIIEINDMTAGGIDFRKLEILMHEMGHVLTFIFGVRVLSKNEFGNIRRDPTWEWDALEIPSLLMEKMASSFSLIKEINETSVDIEAFGAFDELQRARKYMKGIKTLNNVNNVLNEIYFYADGDVNFQRKIKQQLNRLNILPFDNYHTSPTMLAKNAALKAAYPMKHYSYFMADVISEAIFQKCVDGNLINRSVCKNVITQIFTPSHRRATMIGVKKMLDGVRPEDVY